MRKRKKSRYLSPKKNNQRSGYRVNSKKRRKKKSSVRGFFVLTAIILLALFVNHVYPDWIHLFGSKHEDGVLYITFLDVGQGDSIFIANNGMTMLIDAGEQEYADDIIRYIRRYGYSRIDVLVATHAHADHIGGMVDVIGRFDIGSILMPNVQHNTQTFERTLDAILAKNISVYSPTPGDTFEIGAAKVTVLAPFRLSRNDINNSSIVLKVEYGDHAFIFTGDTEAAAEAEILAAGFDISANVLKVSHHGSHSSTTESFLLAVSPEIAVISVASDNSYGHPHRAVLDRLNRIGATIYRTSTHGNIEMNTDGTSLNVKTQRRGWWQP